VKRIVLLGAGHAHALVLKELAKRPLPGEAALTVVNPEPAQIYSGMVPGCVAGHYRLDEIVIDFARLAARAGAQFVRASVAALDPERRQVRLQDGRQLEYDIASLNVGSLTDTSIEGAAQALPVKPLRSFLEKIDRAEDGRIAMVGGGAAGAELAMALAHRGARVTLYSENAIGEPLRGALAASGVAVDESERLAAITKDTTERFDRVVLATGAAPHPWLRASGLALDARGFVLVDETLRSASHAGVFAVGDCATLRSAAHPKSGVYAVRQAPVLAANLRAAAGEEHRYARYKPQRRALMLISCGSKRAIATWGRVSMQGAWLWRVKDMIDRRWIAQFK
jgi:pyridine nucleotide-disulfide oxidoreductase family protein